MNGILTWDDLNKLNVTVFEGLGRFRTQNELEIICPKTNKIKNKISSNKILISVGGKPNKLNIPGVDLAWTSDDIFELEKFPKSILIVEVDILLVNLLLFSEI